MPIYEFYCKDCNTIFNFFSKTINTNKKPKCPKCKTSTLSRQMSAFAFTDKATEDSDIDDLPFDETYKLSMAYAWMGSKQLDFSVGGTLYLMGDAKINQTSIDGTQVIGEFDTNNILFIGGSARYRF